ncbi:metallophosphoesterase family protein [Deinococcus sp.]|uniref:metallophosphoesterase family protein n=1 Tax=Deinococcus sp. TaxID=47478 RepID=UPI003B5BF572
MNIAVLADTHGLLRPEVLPHLRGVDAILHAGDVGDPHILATLATFAPLHAIRGNIDTAPELRHLPETLRLMLGGVQIHLLHDVKTLAFSPQAYGMGVVISGHSHRPRVAEESGVLYLNPGSCGPRRFSLPISLARLTVSGYGNGGETVEAQLITL